MICVYNKATKGLQLYFIKIGVLNLFPYELEQYSTILNTVQYFETAFRVSMILCVSLKDAYLT